MMLRRERKIRFVFWGTMLILLGMALLGGLFFLPQFRIKTIEVSGTETLDAATLHQAIEEWLGGRYFFIFPKALIFFYQPQELDKFLHAKFLRLASVLINFDIRKNTLKVEVKERRPEGLWCLSGSDTCFLFDKEGVLFEAMERPEGSGGLLVEDKKGQTFGLGKQALNPEWIVFMKKLAKEIAPDVWIQEYVIEPESFEAGYIKARTSGQWDILLNAENELLEFYVQALRALLKREIKDNVGRLLYIDLRVPGRAYYKLRD
jgi:cell division septal protein FtsQ